MYADVYHISEKTGIYVSGMLRRHTVDYGEHEIGSTSFLYMLTPESKVASQPDFGEMGPLLGSCLSTPSSPAIVSRSNSLRLILREEPCQNQVVEGDQNEAPDCLVKDKEDEEVQCLKTDRNLDSKFPGSDAAGTQKVELDERKGLEPLLGDGSCYEHTCEAWWKRRGVLLCVQAQQATTLWSLALAAAVMGLVILGHQWQQEWYQNQQLQLQLCSKDEVPYSSGFAFFDLLVLRKTSEMGDTPVLPCLRNAEDFFSFCVCVCSAAENKPSYLPTGSSEGGNVRPPSGASAAVKLHMKNQFLIFRL
jgi:hypothetical protein